MADKHESHAHIFWGILLGGIMLLVMPLSEAAAVGPR